MKRTTAVPAFALARVDDQPDEADERPRLRDPRRKRLLPVADALRVDVRGLEDRQVAVREARRRQARQAGAVALACTAADRDRQARPVGELRDDLAPVGDVELHLRPRRRSRGAVRRRGSRRRSRSGASGQGPRAGRRPAAGAGSDGSPRRSGRRASRGPRSPRRPCLRRSAPRTASVYAESLWSGVQVEAAGLVWAVTAPAAAASERTSASSAGRVHGQADARVIDRTSSSAPVGGSPRHESCRKGQTTRQPGGVTLALRASATAGWLRNSSSPRLVPGPQRPKGGR